MPSCRSRVPASPAQFILRLKKAYQPQGRTRFLAERSGNVYENKGAALEIQERSGNVIENKGSYALKAGMPLKTSMLA
jgi:hypothetical protein